MSSFVVADGGVVVAGGGGGRGGGGGYTRRCWGPKNVVTPLELATAWIKKVQGEVRPCRRSETARRPDIF